MTIYTPTYLYIKQHTITRKCYFGKTTKDPENYIGSGTHWRRHIKKHSKEHILTLWYCLFFDKETISEFALMCSEQWNIIESKDWLNIKPENGMDGACPGVPLSDKHKHSMSISASNRPPCSEQTKQKMSIAKLGVPKSDEHKQKMSIASKGVKKLVVTCPHCLKSGGPGPMARFHFDNCKHIEVSLCVFTKK